MTDATAMWCMARGCGWGARLVVVGYAGGEREESYADPDAQVVQGAGAVAFEAEGAFGGLDDRFDALAHAGDDWCLPGLGFAVWSDDRCSQFGRGGLELMTGVALVGEHGLAAMQSVGQERDRDLPLAAFGRPQSGG